MIIGPVAAGKSSLLAALKMGPETVRKTESLTYNEARSIDTPGEMMGIPRLYNALILNSCRASLVLMAMDGARPVSLPPRIALALKAPVIGVVTKLDLASPEAVERAERALSAAGVTRIFKVSAATGQGLGELRECLEGAGAPPPG
jgi:ethanolamine utilization protein EutP